MRITRFLNSGDLKSRIVRFGSNALVVTIFKSYCLNFHNSDSSFFLYLDLVFYLSCNISPLYLQNEVVI